MLIVTGANGQFGRLVVESLLQRVPADRVGVSVRDPAKAADLAARGVRVRRGDFADPASLADAFEGAERVLVVPINQVGPARVELHRAAIAAAVAAGAGHVLYAGLVDPERSALFPPTADHFATEAALAASGVAFTALRNGFYADAAPLLLRRGLESGVLAAPADGPIAYAAKADLAEAAAIVLAEGGHEGEYLPLTGPAALDLAQLAALAAEVTGRPIRREVVADADFRAALMADGLPAGAAGMLAGLLGASREGQFARVDPTLGRLLGREPAVGPRGVGGRARPGSRLTHRGGGGANSTAIVRMPRSSSSSGSPCLPPCSNRIVLAPARRRPGGSAGGSARGPRSWSRRGG